MISPASHPPPSNGNNVTLQANQTNAPPHDEKWMCLALSQAKEAAALNEVPVGAVVVHDNKIIGQGFNQPIQNHDPSAHAEVQAIREAGQVLGNYRLTEASLYVTLEPCMMCAGVILQARLKEVIFGALDPKTGAVKSVFQLLEAPHLNHRVDVRHGCLAEEAGELLRNFFKARR